MKSYVQPHLSQKETGLTILPNISELLLIFVNIGSGSLILGMNFFKQSGNISLYLLSAWRFGSAVFMLVNRVRRIKDNNRLTDQ